VIWTKEIKQKFIVFVLSGDVDHAVSVKTALAQEGFDSYMFTEQEALIARMKELPPHLIVLSKSGLVSPLQEFVQEIVNLNSETKFLPICALRDAADFMKYREYNFVGLCLDGEGMLSRAAWMADETMKMIYLTYQNEQVFAAMEETKKQMEKIKSEMDMVRVQAEKSAGISLSEEFKKYLHADTKEQVLQIFLRELNQKFLAKNVKISSLYFKFLPTVQSFIATQSLGVEIDSVKGVGGKFTDEESKNPIEMIRSGQIPKMIQELMRDGLSVQDYIMKPVFLGQVLDGFFVIWSGAGKIYSEEIENELSLFLLVYERGHLQKKMASMEISDPITELHNKIHYHKVLTEEVARARRLQKAVSVVKMAVDHLPELGQVLGQGGKDQVLRLMSSVIRKTSRINDVSCRLAENEFALILPHAARKGATLRAERLRRMIESQIFQSLGQKVTVSLGVSEYPSFCSTAEDLDKSATEALSFISKKGGNKVCLFNPKDSFTPDFKVPPL